MFYRIMEELKLFTIFILKTDLENKCLYILKNSEFNVNFKNRMLYFNLIHFSVIQYKFY